MTALPYHRKLARVLDRMGGLFTVNDILTAIAEGRMQSWVYGNSWAITQISNYPQRQVLEILVAVGDLGDCRILHGRILGYAKDCGISLVSTFGRKGWVREADRHGWKIKTTSYLYHRDM